MKITKWTTIDVRYNKGEEILAQKAQKYLERLGYELQERDSGDFPFDFDDQYIKNGRSRIITPIKS